MARETSLTDNLSNEKREIATQLSGDGLALFYGAFPSEGVNEIYWDKEIGGDWREFLKVAKKLEVPVLYIDWIEFTEDYFNEEMPEGGLEGESEEPIRDQQRGLERERFTRYIGLTAAIRLGFFIGNTFHLYVKETQWFQDFSDSVTTGEPSKADENEEDDARERTDIWAEKLSNESEFASLKRRSDKRALLQKLAGNEFKKLPIDNILWRADALRAENLRTANNERLAKQAKELRAKNMSILAIAGKLGIPARQVTILLARFED
jgi:hypothetical protein